MTKLFGTNGIRGIVNQDMTSELALNIGKAWGHYLRKKISRPSLAIGTDARLSNDMLKSGVTAGLLSVGCDVIDIGLVPTPCLQYFVLKQSIDSGVMITASHNPPEFNGIKGIDADGTEFSKETEEDIEEIYFSETAETVPWDQVGKYSKNTEAKDLYIKGLLSSVNAERIKKRSFHVVLDCGNGAGSVVTPQVLKMLGCHVTELYCIPDGRFPGHPSEPTPENLQMLMQTVHKEKPVCGVAQDGDADRAIFIDEQGNYVWGDQTLALFAQYIIEKHPGGIVVTPVTTSTCLSDVVQYNKGSIVFTRVGSPVVARVMKEKKAVFGGEENGGLIFPEFQFCRDSAATIIKFLDMLAVKKKPFSQLLQSIPSYSLVKKKISCPHELKTGILQVLKKNHTDESSIDRIDETDGLKIYSSKGWVLIRPSGTEPIIRVYAEAKTEKHAKDLASTYEQMVKDLIAKKLTKNKVLSTNRHKR